MQFFIVTVDTEGDHQWNYKIGDPIQTENVKYLARFQSLCEKYTLKPVYLTNYEMVQDDGYIEHLAQKAHLGLCEIGMHLHAWNCPPEYELIPSNHPRRGLPYLIEYPYDIMEEKIATMTQLLTKRVGIKPMSHRAGRWATNDKYFKLLAEYGYRADCSVTPFVNWSDCPGYTKNSAGTDYSASSTKPHLLSEVAGNKLYEIPMSVSCSIRYLDLHRPLSLTTLRSFASTLINGKQVWMRFMDANLSQEGVFKYLKSNKEDYLMFMLHSSELMPYGNAYFKTENEVETFYANMEKLFSKAVSMGYQGIDLKSYVRTLELNNQFCKSGGRLCLRR